MRKWIDRHLVALILVACSKGEEPPPITNTRPNMDRESGPSWGAVAGADDPHASGGPTMGTPPKVDPQKRATAMYAMVCQMCHGPEGRGDGANAKNLATKPRDYTDAAWQASVTDADLKAIILKGGAGVGKSAEMPAQPQLEQQPEVLDAMVALIRGFKR